MKIITVNSPKKPFASLQNFFIILNNHSVDQPIYCLNILEKVGIDKQWFISDYHFSIVPKVTFLCGWNQIIDAEDDRWGTVGVSDNIIEASWQALVDSISYKLMKDELQ